MFPLPIISNTNTANDHVVLDVNFDAQSIGSSSVLDSKGHVFSKVGGGTSTVQNDATKGKVMVFSGNTYYTTPIVADLQLASHSFEVRVVFKTAGSSGEQIVFCTGDYYTVPTITAGFLLTIFNNTGTQLFCTDASGNFTRCIFSYTGATWRDISFLWTPASKQMLIKDNDSNTIVGTYTVPNGIGDGSQFTIGGSYLRGATTNTFVGSLKSIKIYRY